MHEVLVVWKPKALAKLADIWLEAKNRDSVNEAVRRIEAFLAHSDVSAGEDYLEGTRLIVAPPLVVVYSIEHDDCRAFVLAVAYRP
jgi:plasmid stabilization system protein ParE